MKFLHREKKIELIQKILDHFDGKKKPVSKKRKAPSGGKKQSPAQKKARRSSTEKVEAKKETKKAK